MVETIVVELSDGEDIIKKIKAMVIIIDIFNTVVQFPRGKY